MNVGCSGSYLLKATGSAIDCFNVVSDISATCTWDVMFASAGATAAQKYIYCAEGGVAGTTYYRANPTSTSSSSQTPTPTPTQSPTPSPTSASKKAPIGAIVGGVIGGLTVITLLVLGLLLLLKKKKQVTVQQPYVTAPELSRGDGVMGSPPAQFQYATASKPTMMEHTSPVSASSQYNQNYSDQHAVQPIPYGQHQQQQPQQYQSGVPQDWVSAAPHAVEMESPGSSPPPQYGNFNPNPTR
ncbi:hypothetical protein BT63DRAFT_424227 [Microthyrium microscopicum]|uniref:Mid2 domain-containing protein n=1 Tax=Microthyrium microscopicum TaxID=703497 RepID=A0A6A6UHC7_9PEZI|nr:hypothetical protein BT63DRAFT_424227 [Microthyrium microscopicum]